MQSLAAAPTACVPLARAAVQRPQAAPAAAGAAGAPPARCVQRSRRTAHSAARRVVMVASAEAGSSGAPAEQQLQAFSQTVPQRVVVEGKLAEVGAFLCVFLWVGGCLPCWAWVGDGGVRHECWLSVCSVLCAVTASTRCQPTPRHVLAADSQRPMHPAAAAVAALLPARSSPPPAACMQSTTPRAPSTTWASHARWLQGGWAAATSAAAPAHVDACWGRPVFLCALSASAQYVSFFPTPL